MNIDSIQMTLEDASKILSDFRWQRPNWDWHLRNLLKWIIENPEKQIDPELKSLAEALIVTNPKIFKDSPSI